MQRKVPFIDATRRSVTESHRGGATRRSLRESFSSSDEATLFMEKIERDLGSSELSQWARDTDRNFGTDTADLLASAVDAYEKFIDAMYNAS